MKYLAIDKLKSIFTGRKPQNELPGNYETYKGIGDDIRKKIILCENNIGYVFTRKELVLEALKHRSYLSVTKEERYKSNERLEFLGDAVLDLIVTEYLYHRYPTYSEGKLSKIKSALVSRAVLAKVSTIIGIGESILLNHGEEKTGGRSRLSLLANTFESILGAIYLDSGYEDSKNFVDKFLLKNATFYSQESDVQNYKSELLEFSQSLGWGSPEYFVINEEGPDHDKIFTLGVKVDSRIVGEGKGASKKNAEQNAAKAALNQLRKGSEEVSEKDEK